MNDSNLKEKLRLEYLRSLQILDTRPEPEYDDLVALASQICQVPIALVTLVDEDRQWFKSNLGMDRAGTSRDMAFCAHAIQQDEIFIVEDATKDSRFRENILVIQDPNIRFYAGAPLKTRDGYHLGTLCVIDRKPRQLNDEQLKALSLLAKQVINLIEVRVRLRDSEKARERSEFLAALSESKAQQEMYKAILAANAKSDFLSKMSHEILTPINGVLGLSNLLLGSSLNLEQRSQTEKIKSSGQVLLNIVNDILDFSDIESGELKIDQSEFSLKQILMEAHIATGYSAAQKNLHFSRYLSPDIPDLIVGDAARVRQVLINLLGNAIKFTPNGHITIRSEVKKRGLQENIRFEIKDTGVGIPKEDLRKLFQSFSQADNSATRKFGGSGLGLVISKELVTMMKGSIGVESELGKGSLFWFELPLTRVSKKAAPKLDRSLKILVAEDNLVSQLVAVNMVESMGYQAEAVTNGVEVLQALENRSFDLILMDCMMPELDGCETAVQIRSAIDKKYLGIPIIAMTDNSFKGQELKCLKSGMNGYIHKPLDEEHLEKLISEIIFQNVA